MLREVGRGIQKFGYGVRVVGAFCLGLAAIIGTAAIDLVLIVAIFKHGGRQNSFLTGFLLGALFFRSNPSCGRNTSLATLFIASLLTSLIAIFLSVFLAVPMVGAFIALAWTVAFAITGAGLLLEKLGEGMSSMVDARRAVPVVQVVVGVPVSTPASPVYHRRTPFNDVPPPYPTVGVAYSRGEVPHLRQDRRAPTMGTALNA